MNPTAIPCVVDLDGTLINSDLLVESFLLLIRRNPLYVFLAVCWLLKGRAALKAHIAQRVKLNAAALPYNLELLSWLKAERETGRPLWLCTASNHRLAALVAGHLGIFDGVLASSDIENLSGETKAARLFAFFGERAFDYCGNHAMDLPVWKVSKGAILVNARAALELQARSSTEIVRTLPRVVRSGPGVVKAMRLHQWSKNILVVVPLLAAHRVRDTAMLLDALVAFWAFGFCASSGYVLNDLVDLEVDRQQPRKRKRPFASGDLSLTVGFVLVPGLLLLSVLLASLLPARFFIVLCTYYVLTTAYSFSLKRVVLVDVLALAGLYAVRVIAGAAAVNVPLSFWLLLFSVFLFLSLAMVKRYSELVIMREQGKLHAVGRGYVVEDLPILQSLGTASGYLCVLVLALYLNTPDVEALYRRPQVIWLLCVLLLYWVSRMWLKAHGGAMHDDPLVFALKDRISLGVGLLSAVTVLLAI
jgi:4-hydroxybenzoate polyprenyltransferase/phosphoserine phosphatase